MRRKLSETIYKIDNCYYINVYWFYINILDVFIFTSTKKKFKTALVNEKHCLTFFHLNKR